MFSAILHGEQVLNKGERLGASNDLILFSAIESRLVDLDNYPEKTALLKYSFYID